MLNTDNTDVFEFGEFRLDARNRLLLRGTRQIGLALKEFEVLFFLVENAGRVVEKTELLEAVWKGTFIEEGTLTQNISRLRKKLEAAEESDNEKSINGKIIETLPKRGYRFLPIVTRRQIAAPLVIVEEHAIQRISVEQMISLPDDAVFNLLAVANSEPKALSAAPGTPKFKSRIPRWLWLSVTAFIFFAAVFFVWRNAAVPPKSLTATSVVPFSGAPGREDTPAFSPDGKQLVYVWNSDEGEQTDIYVRLTAGGEPVRLTDTDAKEQYPVFSPDGSQIAFVRDYKTYGEVFLMPALGGTERRICRLFSGNYSISFAPGGKELAVIDTEDSTDKKQFAVYLVNLETGIRRRLTAPGEFRGETTPRFAPDGKSLAFVRVFGDQQHDLFVVPVTAEENAAPTEPQQITFDRKTIHSLAWSADGAAIFFVSFRVGDRAGLWHVSANGGAEPETVLTGSWEITNLTVSPDGKTVAFVELAPRDPDIWQAAANGEQKPQKFLASTFSEIYPAFAPDDLNVVFTSNRSGKNDLWMVDRAGKNLRQLTKTDVNVRKAAFSPDGKRAAFEAVGNTAGEIFTVEIETGATRRLVAASDSFNLSPAWSADGRFVYFTSNRTGAEQIWKIAADGANQEPVQITARGGSRAFPAPDGTLFFNKSRDKADFWQIPADGSGANERAVPGIASIAAVGWTSNRAGIYLFVPESEDFYEIKFYDFAARQVNQSFGKVKLPAQMLNASTVSPDGKRFLFATNKPDASRVMLAVLKQ